MYEKEDCCFEKPMCYERLSLVLQCEELIVPIFVEMIVIIGKMSMEQAYL